MEAEEINGLEKETRAGDSTWQFALKDEAETISVNNNQGNMKARLPKHWKNLESRARVLCRLNLGYETEVEPLVALYLHLSTEPSYQRLKKFCGVKKTDVESALIEIDKEISKRLSAVNPETMNFIVYAPAKTKQGEVNERTLRGALKYQVQINEHMDLSEASLPYQGNDDNVRNGTLADSAKKYLQKHPNSAKAMTAYVPCEPSDEDVLPTLPSRGNYHHNRNSSRYNAGHIKPPYDITESSPKDHTVQPTPAFNDAAMMDVLWFLIPAFAVLFIFMLCIILWLLRTRRKGCEGRGKCKCTYKGEGDVPILAKTKPTVHDVGMSNDIPKSIAESSSVRRSMKLNEPSMYSKAGPSAGPRAGRSAGPSAGVAESRNGESERQRWLSDNENFYYIDVGSGSEGE